ncbi:hypothetical protein [Aliikangiella coralliicola]|uniref:Uncharacterized protein n=1 Tax=Aliikangiella coralliicola TaxID=2592383 RepID=A0A545UHW4_9GAMM|nr:hypothetical protein [Aliikangiella coralliicola]TQV89055.1 hypothetical protein FLL46_05865 [Aliikangiella coralliicola]
MKFPIKSVIPASLAILLSSQTFAETPKLDARQANQKNRIIQGIDSGELTKKEANRLVQGQRELNRMEKRAKSDGIVTKKEKARLHNKADKESAKIAKNKHDRQKRAKAKSH